MPSKRRIAVLTTGRQDYGILRSTLMLLAKDSEFDLRLWIGGMHLLARFGRTIELVRKDALPIAREIPFVAEPPEPSSDAARALEAVSEALAADSPQVLMLLGDRSEVLAAGVAAAIARVPIVHIHGGEESEGAIDNLFRHALTKLSHLHLVSHAVHAGRIIQMGEDPKHVVVVGAPGLDNLLRDDLASPIQVAKALGTDLSPPVVIVTVHPATLEGDPLREVTSVAAALEAVPATYVICQPNADAGGTEIRRFWGEWAKGRKRVCVVDALGDQMYWSLLKFASAVVGNSSSGIIEAPAAGVPSVNVGERQVGRLRGGPVMDVPADENLIAEALRTALQPNDRNTARDAGPVFPSGPAAPRIIAALRQWMPELQPRKHFHDLSWLSAD